MALYKVENQWGGNSAPWNPGGNWVIGSRSNQNVVAINVKSDDGGQTLNGTMTYSGEGSIGFRATRTSGNNYTVENQWGGNSAPWNPGGNWVIGSRSNQNVVAINVKSDDGGQTLNGTMTYSGEGSIGFKGTMVEESADTKVNSYIRFPETHPSTWKDPGKVHFDKINHSFDTHVWHHTKVNWCNRTTPIKRIHINEGELYIDGHHIVNPHWGRDFVSFAQEVGGKFRSGHLNFTPDGHAFTGHIFLGTNGNDAQQHQVAGVVPPTVYTTKVAKSGETKPPKKDVPDWFPQKARSFIDDDGAYKGSNVSSFSASDWEDGVTITIGYKLDANAHGTKLPTPYWEIAGDKRLGKRIIPSVSPKGNLVLTETIPVMEANSIVKQFGDQFPVELTVEVTLFAGHFVGYIRKWDKTKFEVSKEIFAFVGQAIPNQTKISLPHTRNTSNFHVLAGLQSATPSSLSMAELVGLVAEHNALQETSWAMIQDNMKWALDQKGGDQKQWLTNFFSEKSSNFSKSRQDLIKKDLNFYTDKMAVSILAHSFQNISGTGELKPEYKLTSQQDTNILFWMRAGLGTSKGYSRQNQGIFLQTYAASVPRIQDYIADQNSPGGTNWAQELYNQLTNPATLNLTAQKIIFGSGNNSAGLTEVNRHSTLLQVLQPTGDLAKKYHNIIVQRILQDQSLTTCIDLSDPKKIAPWLEDVLRGFAEAYESGRLQIKDPANQAAIDAAKVALDADLAKAKGFVELAAASADIIAAANAGAKAADYWTNLFKSSQGLAKVYPGVALLFYFGAFVGGIYGTSQAFAQFEQEPWNEKAELVTSWVVIGLKILENAPTMMRVVWSGGRTVASAIGRGGRNAITAIRNWSNTAQQGGDLGLQEADYIAIEDLSMASSNSTILDEGIELLVRRDPTFMERGTQALSEIADAALAAIRNAGSRLSNAIGEAIEAVGNAWSRFVNFAETSILPLLSKALTGIFAVASVAMAVFSTVEFIQDIEDGKGTEETILDGVMAASAWVGAAAAVYMGLATLEVVAVVSWVPVVGAVAAVIGIVAALWAAFSPKPTPPTPQESFMKNYGKKAVAADGFIKAAPTGWTKDQPVPKYNVYNPQPAMT
ncbi:MAG: hypothetical protein RID53_24230 [Coleofasciculus sp. B1-GNL1-01]